MRLTTYLTSRLFMSGIIILLITIGWLMFTNHQSVQENVQKASDTIVRILEIQSVGPLQGIGMESRFPDWYPVTQVNLPPGACVKFLTADGNIRHSTCRGKGQSQNQIPSLFTFIYSRLFTVAAVARRDFLVRNAQYSIEIIPDAETEIAAVWNRTKLALTLSLLVILVLGVTAAWLINRAFRPIRSIVDSLERIGRGDFDARLGAFRFSELNHIAGSCNKLATELGARNRQRDALFKRLQTAQEDERRAIALELHDEFGQYLTAINANALALQNTRDINTVNADASRIQDSVERLMAMVQELLSRLKPHPGTNNSVVDMVKNLLAEAADLQADNFDIQLNIDGPVDDCPEKLAMVVYRILQEALTNIRKHTDASHATVNLALHEYVFEISISDNGSSKTANDIVPGFGISGMRERAAAVGGRLELLNLGAQGLTIHARFPIYREEST